MKIDDPGGTGQRAEAVWMYLVQHGPDDEALAAVNTGGQWFPMVATTEESLKTIGDAAQTVATLAGKPLLLARFDRRTDIGKVVP